MGYSGLTFFSLWFMVIEAGEDNWNSFNVKKIEGKTNEVSQLMYTHTYISHILGIDKSMFWYLFLHSNPLV
jgi:hypothetical protein